MTFGSPGAVIRLRIRAWQVRCLNLLCPLSFHFEAIRVIRVTLVSLCFAAGLAQGRSSCLELRAELARRVSLARPFHFGEAGEQKTRPTLRKIPGSLRFRCWTCEPVSCF